MRVSEGVPSGRIAELYNPKMFQEHEEVIIFTREEFNWTYTNIQEQIEYTNKIYFHLNKSEEWKLLGHWPKILERINIIDVNMNQFFEYKPVQCYLDAYLYNMIKNSQKKHVASPKEVEVQLKLPI